VFLEINGHLQAQGQAARVLSNMTECTSWYALRTSIKTAFSLLHLLGSGVPRVVDIICN
jgi:hypothetical protein